MRKMLNQIFTSRYVKLLCVILFAAAAFMFFYSTLLPHNITDLCGYLFLCGISVFWLLSQKLNKKICIIFSIIGSFLASPIALFMGIFAGNLSACTTTYTCWLIFFFSFISTILLLGAIPGFVLGVIVVTIVKLIYQKDKK